MIDQLKNEFWQQWRSEYLPTLQQVRSSWTGPPVELKLGDLVVVNDDKLLLDAGRSGAL